MGNRRFRKLTTQLAPSDVIRKTLDSTTFLFNTYLTDLSDADLLVRPVPNSNHIAWQLGHLITSEIGIVTEQIPSTKYPELPPGFAEQHGPKTAQVDPPTGFATKAVYLELTEKVRTATLAALAQLSDADLDKPTVGNMASFAPTLTDAFLLLGNHTMMHAGQFTCVRRKLGKPVLM